MCRRPALPDPLFLDRRYTKDFPDLGNGEVEVRQPLHCVEKGLRHVVRVAELIRAQRDRAWQEPDDLINPIALVDKVRSSASRRIDFSSPTI